MGTTPLSLHRQTGTAPPAKAPGHVPKDGAGNDPFGGAAWPIGGNEAHIGPRFDVSVSPGGYAWWYCDALSDDGHFGITIIAFIGSVFSPYYAWSGRKDPFDHCAVNVALYGRDLKRSWLKGRWAMTERRRPEVRNDAGTLEIGSSALNWDGTALTVDIHETSAPIPLPVRGRLRLYPEGITRQIFALDADGHHRWWPISPSARVEVEMESPGLSWSGNGYFDSNDGEIPLEESFDRWDWSRLAMPSGAAVLYDVTRLNGPQLSLALRFTPTGEVEPFTPPERVRLPPTVWRVDRQTQAEDGAAKVLTTFEDTPFYARSEIETQVLGGRHSAIHESLSLERFRSDWVKMLLPFRMPRSPLPA